MTARHPNLDEAIAAFRGEFLAGHSINYSPALSLQEGKTP
jgi:hypothetical protein